MKRHSGHIVVFIFMFTFLSMAACSKPVQPTIYTGMKSEISIEAKNFNDNGLALAQKGQYERARLYGCLCQLQQSLLRNRQL